MKKIILFTLSVLCVMLLLVGCGGSSELIGVWKEVDGEGILYFAEDNTGLSANVTYTSESFEYEEKDEKLVFVAESRVETEYTVEEKTLTIKHGGNEYIYTLVELSESEINDYLIEHGIEIKDPPMGGTNESDVTSEIPSKDTLENGDDPENLTDEKITESILGAWRGGDENMTLVYIFYEDGTGYAGLLPFTYSVKDGVISVKIEAFGEVEYGSGKYAVDGDLLNIENSKGEVYVLERTEMPDLPELSK